MKRAHAAWLALVVVVFVALCCITALTWRPRADEGFFASPGLNLATTGSMGTPVLEGSHAFMKDIHKYTYWITPFHFVVQAAWYKIAGFSMFNMRLLSMLFALLALAAWFSITRRASGNDALAVLSVALIALDYNFIIGGSSGRMDMMAAGLGISGIAAYLALRERHFTAAILASNALACAAGLTHPVAGYLYFAGVVFVTVYLDHSRVRLRQVAVAGVPYIIGGIAWGLYILKDPAAFMAQFATNATMHGRLTGLDAPWMGIINEVRLRYLNSFGLGLHSITNEGPIFLKSLVLVAFIIGLVGAVVTGAIRRNRGYRLLMYLALLFFLLLSVLDGQKYYYYLIHIFPFYAALAAAWVFHLWRNRPVLRPVLGLAVAGVLSLQTGAALYHARQNPYGKTYAPAIAFLKQTVTPNDTLMGSASLGFGLGFPPNLVDDVRLGYFSQRKPDYIVVNEEYYLVFRDYKTNEPAIYRHIVNRLTNEYDRIYDQAGFQVYVLKDKPLAASVRRISSPGGFTYP